jgi:hypothetical protein
MAGIRISGGDRDIFSGFDGTGTIVDTSGTVAAKVGAGELSKKDYHTMMSEAGTFQVFGSHNGTTWSPALGMIPLCGVSTALVVTSVATQYYTITGAFKHLKVVGSSATNFGMVSARLK